MLNLLSHPLLLDIFNSLAWGPPYWPEAGVAFAAITLSLWLALRISRRREGPPAPAPTRAEPEGEDIYEAAREEMRREAAPPEEAAIEAPSPAPDVEDALLSPPTPTPPIEKASELIEEAPPVEDFLTRLKKGLRQTQENFIGRIDAIMGGRKIDEDLYEELEEALITADLGVDTAYRLLAKIQKEGERGALKDAEATRKLLRREALGILERVEVPLVIGDKKPFVIMTLGVNGVGKTTTIAKLAFKFREEGKKVLLAAGDTFRAAAIEQLGLWADRVGAGIVKHTAGSDPSAVAFDAIKAAKARGVDVVIVDTAGRIHTRVPLMEELKKVKRIIGREMDGAPHETLLVLDSTTGQNAISQAQSFNEALGVTGIALTKLDGTAKGGVIVGISDKLKIPIRFIGIGEKMYDLVEFKAEPFVEALFSE